MTMHSAALQKRIEELEAETQLKSAKIQQLILATAEAADKLSVFMSIFHEHSAQPRLTGKVEDVIVFGQLRLEGFPNALKMLRAAVAFSLDRPVWEGAR